MDCFASLAMTTRIERVPLIHLDVRGLDDRPPALGFRLLIGAQRLRRLLVDRRHLDSKGDIYVGEVGVTNWKTSFPGVEMPPEVRASRCLQKLEKI